MKWIISMSQSMADEIAPDFFRNQRGGGAIRKIVAEQSKVLSDCI